MQPVQIFMRLKIISHIPITNNVIHRISKHIVNVFALFPHVVTVIS